MSAIDKLRRQTRSKPDSPPQADGIPVDDLAYHPFPVDAIPEPIRRFVIESAESLDADPSFVALPLLAAIGGAIGNTRRLEVKGGYRVPPAIWGICVGESGSGKTPAFDAAMRFVRKRQSDAFSLYREAFQQYEIEMCKWEIADADFRRKKSSGDPPLKPKPPVRARYAVTDCTVESLAPLLSENPRGLLLARDELAGWFGSFNRYTKGNTDCSDWLSTFNGQPITVDRKSASVPVIHAPSALISVCGGIQPGTLRSAMSSENRENGMLARMLFAYPPYQGGRWSETVVGEEAVEAVSAVFDTLYSLRPGLSSDGEEYPIAVKLGQDAKSEYVRFHEAHRLEQSSLEGDFRSAWSKLLETPLRVGLILHLVRRSVGDASDGFVDVDTMRAAIRLTEWFKHECKRVYEMFAESEDDRDRRKLIEWIELRGGTATARDVQMGRRSLRAPGAADMALNDLIRLGRGRWVDSPSSDKGGRPSRVFTLVNCQLSTKPTSDDACQLNPQNHRENGVSLTVDTVDIGNSPIEEGEI